MDYEKALADQRREIKQLREQLEAVNQVDKIADALILAVLMAAGADQEHPVKVDKAKIDEMLRTSDIRLAIEATPDGYSMHYSVNE